LRFGPRPEGKPWRDIAKTTAGARVDLYKPGFLIPAPDAPWIECVGAPKPFGLAFTPGGEVLRICSLVRRTGQLVGARFLTSKELRQGLAPMNTDPECRQAD
jgi:hypothetical protein